MYLLYIFKAINSYCSHDNFKENEVKIISILLQCIKEFINIEWGLVQFLNISESFNKIILCLNIQNTDIISLVFDILSVSCFYSETAYSDICEAFEYFRLTFREPMRYCCIKKIINDNNNNFELILDIVLFINSFVDKSSDLTERVEVLNYYYYYIR